MFNTVRLIFLSTSFGVWESCNIVWFPERCKAEGQLYPSFGWFTPGHRFSLSCQIFTFEHWSNFPVITYMLERLAENKRVRGHWKETRPDYSVKEVALYFFRSGKNGQVYMCMMKTMRFVCICKFVGVWVCYRCMCGFLKAGIFKRFLFLSFFFFPSFCVEVPAAFWPDFDMCSVCFFVSFLGSWVQERVP